MGTMIRHLERAYDDGLIDGMMFEKNARMFIKDFLCPVLMKSSVELLLSCIR